MKILTLILVVLFSSNLLFGQNCACPSDNISGNKKPNKTFKFSNGKSIGLCGDFTIQNNEKQYSESVIYKCGQENSLLEFDGTTSYTIEQNKDTVIIQEFYIIANGKNLSLKWSKFYLTKLFWESAQLKQKSYYKKDLRKYSDFEIEKVLNEYRTTQNYKILNFDKILLIGHRLFWAYASGSKKAGQYLEDFENKYGPFDGAISEEFNDIFTTYEHYKEIEVQRR